MSFPYNNNFSCPSSYKANISTRPNMGTYLSSDGGRLFSTNTKPLSMEPLTKHIINKRMSSSKLDNWRTTEKNPHSQVMLFKRDSIDHCYDNRPLSMIHPKISENFLDTPNMSENLSTKKPSRFLRNIDYKPEKKMPDLSENPVSACEKKIAELKLRFAKPRSIAKDHIENKSISEVVNDNLTQFEISSNESSPFASLNVNLEEVNIDYPNVNENDSIISDICEKLEALHINTDNDNHQISSTNEISNDSFTNILETKSNDTIMTPNHLDNICTHSQPENTVENCINSTNITPDMENIRDNTSDKDIFQLELIETTSPLTPETFDYEDVYEKCYESKNKNINNHKTKKRSKSTNKSDRNKCDIDNSSVKSAAYSGKHKAKKERRQNKTNVFTLDESTPAPMEMPSSVPMYFCTLSSKLFYKTKTPHRKQNKRRNHSSTNKLNEYISLLTKMTCRRDPMIKDEPIIEPPKEVNFDEMAGKFINLSSCDDTSDDEFTIVFSDTVDGDTSQNCYKPPGRNVRYDSECDSEDSFVVCFDSDCEVDGAYTVETETSEEESSDEDDTSDDEEASEEDTLTDGLNKRMKGCLKKSRSRGSTPSYASKKKKVSFDTAPPQIYQLIEWSDEYKQARIGNWEKDAKRFKQRIMDLSVCLDRVLKREHRNIIFFQRFRPILMREERKAREEAKLKHKQEEAAKASESSNQITTPCLSSNPSNSELIIVS